MDAAEDDQDVKLQRASADLLADFQSSLKPFLWKTTKSGKTRIRDRVRVRDTARLVNLLEPFQELPQLLDPHLDKFVPVLAGAFLASLQAPTPKYPPTNAQLLMPVSKAICKLLYTFCKIRGDKVIVRFWATDTKYLELLLAASESNTRAAGSTEEEKVVAWDWEERYITLLWLSQLLLAPFDLASISSRDTEDVATPDIPGLVWPSNIPTITLRAISLGVKYLSSSGKERDAAKVLLVRIAMRRDMQALGIQDALMQWAISCLHLSAIPDSSTYQIIGVLSFIAAILISSVGTTNMDSFVSHIFKAVRDIATDKSTVSAVARKAIIKILRTIVVLLLQGPDPNEEVLEFTIGHMLESLADSATPVRLAASKALSIITLKLPSEMAAQVVEEVLDSLRKNLLWTQKPRSEVKIRNLSRVNPLEWHGLTLTLSHLLYRQSIAPENLGPVLDALRLALSFEQRSTSGSSIGTNVRDAACFGIWAVARRYRTTDLQDLHLTPDVSTDSVVEASVSALQTLANDLVVSACLDPAGNIRRGSSAALQELIGRHPNTMSEGIQVVQVVDYHAVALRTRAINDVAKQASQLSKEYHGAILQALLDWRGVKDGSTSVRKVAASSIGALVWHQHLSMSHSWLYIQSAIDDIAKRVENLDAREVDERHGLVFAFASIVARVAAALGDDQLHSEFHRVQENTPPIQESGLYDTLVKINLHLAEFLREFGTLTQSSRNQDILAEAFCGLTIATGPIPRIASIVGTFGVLHKATGDNVPHCEGQCWIRDLIMTQLDCNSYEHILEAESNLFTAFMKNATVGNFGLLSEAVEEFIGLESGLLKRTPYSALLVDQCISNVVSNRKKDLVYIHVLVRVFPVVGKVRAPATLQNDALANVLDDNNNWEPRNWQTCVLRAIQARWRSDSYVDIRTAILQALARPPVSKERWDIGILDHPCIGSSLISNDLPTMLMSLKASFVGMIQEGLEDFTTNARGDVGSLVRIAAAEAAALVLSRLRPMGLKPDDMSVLKAMEEKVVGGLFRTAAEKLDKVRVAGQKAVSELNGTHLRSFDSSSQAYFAHLLGLQNQSWWRECPRSVPWATNLLEGYVTSADTGSEDLVRASRAALVDFCNNGNGDALCRDLDHLAGSSVDRVLIPTLEVIGFLFDMQIMQKSSLNWKSFYNKVQRAHYKSSNIRKLQTAIKIYGGLMEVHPEAVTKLSSMLLHNFPGIRNAAAEELWVVTGVESLKGVDWAKAKKPDLERVRADLKTRGF